VSTARLTTQIKKLKKIMARIDEENRLDILFLKTLLEE